MKNENIQKIIDMFYIAELGDWFMFKDSKYIIVIIKHIHIPNMDIKQLIFACGNDVFVVNYFNGKNVGGMRQIYDENT